MKGHQQSTGRAQSPLSSAFPIIILWIIPKLNLKGLLDGHGAQTGSLGEIAKVCGPIRYPSALANSLHGLEDHVHHLCVVKSVHSALQMTLLAPLAVRGISSMAFCAWLTS